MNTRNFLSLFAAALIGTGWSYDAGRYPLRQIDRPLIPPKGMWQELLMHNTIIHVEDESTYVDEDLVAGFLPTLPSLSLTDNLQWTFVPAPMFRYLLTRNNINAENGPVVKDFSLTLEGGLSGITVAKDNADFLYQLGMSAKKPLGERIWLDGMAHSYYKDLHALSLATTIGLGFQFTDRVYGTTQYSLTHMYEDGYRIYHGGAAAFGINFTHNISLALSGSLLVGSQALTLNPGAVLAFNW